MAYWLITGRLEYDDEDTALTFECRTQAQACKAFRVQMREGLSRSDKREVYINTVAKSDAPITIMSGG